MIMYGSSGGLVLRCIQVFPRIHILCFLSPINLSSSNQDEEMKMTVFSLKMYIILKSYCLGVNIRRVAMLVLFYVL